MSLEQFLLSLHHVGPMRKDVYRCAFKALEKACPDWQNVDNAGMNWVLDSFARMYSPNSWNVYVQCLRIFYRWLGRSEVFEGLKLKRIKRIDYIAKKIMSPKEVKALIRGAIHPRDRALLAVGAATGARRGEFVGMSMRDVEVFPYGYRIIILNSKTVAHKTPPITGEFAKIFRVWLEHHPFRDNPDAPLWPNLKSSGMKALGKTQLHMIIKNAARRAGLKRNIHWHMLRHTENTWSTKKGISRATRNITHGWSQSSNTAAIYENLTDADAEREYLKSVGIVKEEVERDAFETVKCTYCGEENSSINKFCHYCGTNLLEERVTFESLLEQFRQMQREVQELKKKES